MQAQLRELIDWLHNTKSAQCGKWTASAFFSSYERRSGPRLDALPSIVLSKSAGPEDHRRAQDEVFVRECNVPLTIFCI